MSVKALLLLLIAIAIQACSEKDLIGISPILLDGEQSLTGKKEYLASPYVTAGDRVYMVGHQDGSFPDLGWHVEGEMGGIWNHPIKLMDGFTAAIALENQSFCLDRADSFVNYPFANKHIFSSAVPGFHIERVQFVPEGKEGLIIQFQFTNKTQNQKTVGFEWTGHTDLMPVWLGEEAGMIDHADELTYDEVRNAWLGKDGGNPWFVLFGSQEKAKHREGSSITCDYTPKGQGAVGSLGYELTIEPSEMKVLQFVIAGSYTSQADVERTFDLLNAYAPVYLEDKKRHYEQIAGKSRISIPNPKMEEAVAWIKYNTEWLVRDVPEIGRGLGAGMPDYPWWFGVDNCYTLMGAIATGRKNLVYQTIELIHNLSESNGNGRIIHEVSTNGVVFNPGNINETPQFASLIWWVYNWTGDKEFLEKYFPSIEKGLQWLMEENDQDGNLFPDGYGMMEIHGLASEMIDVAAYSQRAFQDAAFMARELGKTALAESYQHTADLMKEKINQEFWVEEFNGYADFIGTVGEALHLIDDAIIRADSLDKPWAVDELKETKRKLAGLPKSQKQGFVVFHNWVVNTPMETGIAPDDKAIRALDKARKFINPFGVFVTGIDRDESSEQEDGSFAGSKVFSYTGAVMTLPTGVSAIAENNYGRPDMALDYLQRMTNSFSFALPGSMYEVSPDYGMMAQAWNIYSYAVPIVTQFFGIQPKAQEKVIHIKPQLPSSWNEVGIEHVIVGDNSIDFGINKSANSMTIVVRQKLPDWKINLNLPKESYSNVSVNGISYEDVEWEFQLSGKENTIVFLK